MVAANRSWGPKQRS